MVTYNRFVVTRFRSGRLYLDIYCLWPHIEEALNSGSAIHTCARESGMKFFPVALSMFLATAGSAFAIEPV